MSSRVRFAAGAMLVMFVGVTCTDGGVTGPRSGGGLLARLGFAPAFTRAATAIFQNLEAFGYEVNNVHVHLTRANGATAKDTIVSIAPGQDSVVIQMGISLIGTEEDLTADLELRDDNVVLFSGTQKVTARAGGSAAPPPPISVDYIGPGAGAKTLTLSPIDTTITAGDTVRFRPVAKDNTGQTIASLALAWSVQDPLRGTVNGNGVFKATTGVGRGRTYVISRLLSGPKDSAAITISLPASQVAIVGGSTSGIVGRQIAQKVVVESQASDGLPVPFTPLTIALTPNGGPATSLAGLTDANGRATIAMQLGPVAGVNLIQVSGSGIAPVSITITGTPDKAVGLAMLQQPSSTTASGAPLATQPSVRLKDVFGNNVSSASVAVTAAITAPPNSHTVSGTVIAVTDGNGVAQFTDLRVSGLVTMGATSLTFSQDTLSSTTSAPINVVPGPPAAMALESVGQSVTWPAGGPFDNAPAIRIIDDAGNGIANVDVHLEVRNTDLALVSTDVKTDQDGRALFTQLSIPVVAASYYMVATSTAFPGVTRAIPLTIVSAAADRLRFLQQPTNGLGAGTPMNVSIEVLDRFNNRVTAGVTSQTPITLTLLGGTAGATLSPVNAANAVAGLASLSVSINLSGTAYRMTAVAAEQGIASVTSVEFSVGVGGPANIVAVAGQGAGLLKGEEVVLRARVTDASGTNIAGTAVTFAVSSGGGTLSSGTVPITTQTGTDGTAAVDFRPGSSGVQLVRASAASAAVDFTVFIAETLAVVRQPTLTPRSGVPLPVQPRVELRDLQGNAVKRAGVPILAEYQRDPVNQDLVTTLSGSVVAVTDANGAASWTDLTLAGQTPAGAPQTVKFAFSEGVEIQTIAPTFSQIMTLGVGLANTFAPENFGNPYYFFDATTQGPAVGVLVTDGRNPVANASVTFTGYRGTCLSAPVTTTTDAAGVARAPVTAPAPQTSCAIEAHPGAATPFPPGQYVLLNVYNSRSGLPVWLGTVSSDWNDKANWYQGLVPPTGGDAFVPAGWFGVPQAGSVNAVPLLSADTTRFLSLYLEAGANLETGGKTITVNGDLAVDGTISGGGTVVAQGSDGEFRAGYIQGLLKVGPSADYSVSGTVIADSLEVNSFLRIDMDVVVITTGAFRAQGNAQLYQSKGSILIQTDATFDGNAILTGGVLQVMGNFTHNGNCDNLRFNASETHYTQLIGDATKNPLLLTWNSGCGSRFGILAIQTTGANGVALSTTNTIPQSLGVNQLVIGSGTSLNVPLLFNVAIDPGPVPTRGTFTIVDDAGVLRLQSLLSMPTALDCGLKPLVQGDNRGPLSCTMR